MATATLRPNATQIAGGSASIGGGAASHHAAQSDNNDATYSRLPNTGAGNNHYVLLDFGTVVIPANAQIRSVTPRLRHNRINPPDNNQVFNLQTSILTDPVFGNESFQTTPGSMTTQSGTTRTLSPRGDAWTQADIDALQLFMRNLNTSLTLPFDVAESYIDVVYNESPTATGAALGTVGTSRPAFAWTYSDPESDPQEKFRVKVFTAAQVAAGGFDPNTTTPVVDSGVVASSTPSWTCTTDLTNGTSYRAYIWVSDLGSNGRFNVVTSSGPYSSATIAMAPPAVPTLAVVPDEANSRQVLTLSDRQNLLSDNDSSLETSIGGWTAQYGCSVARTLTTAPAGSAVLDVTSAATDFNRAQLAHYAVTPGEKYSATCEVRAATNPRTVSIQIWWYAANGTTQLGTAAGPAMASVAGSSRLYAVTGVAPVGAVYARLVVQVVAAPVAEHHYFDAFQLVPGALNLLDNPIFEADSNGDGIADGATAYTFGGGDPAAVYALQSAAGFVLAGLYSQQLGWSVNTGWKGLSWAVNATIVSGQQYTVSAWVRLDNAGSVNLYYAGSGNPNQTTALSADTWARISLTFTAGANEYGQTLYVRSNSPANTLWIGHLQVELGSTASTEVASRYKWNRGGLLSLARFEVQRSIDGGATWENLERLWVSGSAMTDLSAIDYSDATQSLVAYDYEAPRGVAVQYRARTKAVISGQTLPSSWSFWVSAAALDISGWVLKSTTDPSFNVTGLAVKWETFNEDEPIDSATFDPVDSDETIVIQGRTRGKTLSFTLQFWDAESFDAYAELRRRKETLLFQDSNGRQWFVRIVGGRRARERRYNGVICRELPVEMVEVAA